MLPGGWILIDFEGYMSGNLFYFKEFAVYEDNQYRNFFVKTQNLYKDNTYYWLLANYHKLPEWYGTTPIKSIIEILNQDKVIYCKGLQKVNILKQYTNQQIINLEDLGCPKLIYLPTPQIHLVCDFEPHKDSHHCALKKVHLLSNWLWKNKSKN